MLADSAFQVVLNRLACPACHGQLAVDESLSCTACARRYPIVDGVVDLRPDRVDEKPEVFAWTEHWSAAKQRSTVQRFFSFYRQAVFAPAIAYYVDRFLPASGVLVEAGSGTSETSARIETRSGGRVLVAMDLIVPVLRRCHPIMTVRVAADAFRMPFATGSLDGIWNVGVMEHFEPADIDRMLTEFHRVLKPGGVLLLFWPGRDSVPQRLLRTIEWVVNRHRRGTRFRFHPDEISQLRSTRAGREVLGRNGFAVVRADYGWRTLLAFKVLVGTKLA